MPTIKRVFIRHYTDNGSTKVYVEWANGSRTEGNVCGRKGLGAHMTALLERAKRQGLKVERETW